MRSLYSEQFQFDKILSSGSSIHIEGQDYHHLINVLRAKINDSILLINGKGSCLNTCIFQIDTKKSILELKHNGMSNFQTKTRPYNISLLLCIPKKPTLEEIWLTSIQLGIKNLYLWKSERSQPFVSIDERRFNLIAKQSMEQSNNPWLTQIQIIDPLKEHLKIDHHFLFSSSIAHLNTTSRSNFKLQQSEEILYTVGPEGGLTIQEEIQLQNLLKAHIINLPTPILKSETAVSAGFGYLLSKFL